MKRTMSVITAILLSFCIIIAPITTVAAVGETSETESESVFDSDIYYAEVLTGSHELGQNAYSAIRFKTDHDSPATILANQIMDNQSLMDEMTVWKGLTFKPSSAEEEVLKESDYYEAIVLSALKTSTSSSFIKKYVNNNIEKEAQALFGNFQNILKAHYGVTYVAQLSPAALSNLPSDELESSFGKAFKESYPNVSDVGKFFKYFKKAVKYCKTYEQVLMNFSCYVECCMMEDSLKQVIADLYNNCDDSNYALKQALYKVYTASQSYESALEVGAYDIGERVAFLVVEEVTDKIYDAIIKLNPLLTSLSIGQGVGSGLANFLFNTDAIVEQSYKLIAFSQFEALVSRVAIQNIVNFRYDPINSNAKRLISTIDVLYKNYEDGCDAAKNLFDLIYTDNKYMNLLCVFDPSVGEEYYQAINSIASLKLYNEESYESLRRFYYASLSVDYPELYQIAVNSGETYSLPVQASGNCGINGDNVSYIIDANGVLIISGTGKMETHATSSDYPWFNYKSQISHVAVQYGVTNVASNAFDGYSNLESIYLANSVDTISANAFYNCTSVESCVLPNSLKVIDSYAFSNCTSAFSDGLEIPVGTTQIGIGAFKGCSSITGLIQVPKSVTIIGQNVFQNTSPTKLVIPFVGGSRSNSSPLHYFFDGNSTGYPQSLIELTITDATSISGNLCSGSNIKTITLNEGLESIPAYAFYYLGTLENISIPSTVTSIGYDAFGFCKNLVNITIPGNVLDIGASAFTYCSKLSNVTLCNGIESIGANVFNYCDALESITVPDSVTEIGYCVFGECANLKHVIFGNGIERMEGGHTFDNCRNLETVILSNRLKEVPDTCFMYCEKLTDITIPSSVTNIGYMAFYGCYSLDSVTISNGLQTIEEGAFAYCTSLESITIPDSVTDIGNYAFYWCTDLKNVELSNSLTKINGGAFQECRSIESIVIPDSVTDICGSAFWNSGLTDLTIGNGVKTIESYAFRNCNRLTNVFIPNNVKSISSSAFSGCTNLKAFDVLDSNSNYSVLNGVLFDKPKNKIITYPAGKENTTYIIPESVSSISGYAFEGSGNL